MDAAREDEHEKRELSQSKRDVIDRLATSSGNARAITADAQKIILKRSTARRAPAASAALHATALNGEVSTPTALGSTFTIRGLKPVVAPKPPSPPYSAFKKLKITHKYY